MARSGTALKTGCFIDDVMRGHGMGLKLRGHDRVHHYITQYIIIHSHHFTFRYPKMSSDGEVWVALTTCNTDSNVLMLFMSHLAKAFTKESADWRNSTVFVLDGVSVRQLSPYLCSFIGILSQVWREPKLLSALRIADYPQCSVQLQCGASWILVCTA